MTALSVRNQWKHESGGKPQESVEVTRDKPELSFGTLVSQKVTLLAAVLLENAVSLWPIFNPIQETQYGITRNISLNDYVSWNVGSLINFQYRVILKLYKESCQLGFWLFTSDTWAKEADDTVKTASRWEWGPEFWLWPESRLVTAVWSGS